MADRPLLRRQLAEQEPQQRRLARAVGADDPDLVAAHDRRGQVADDRAVVVTKADPLGLDHQRARALGLLDLHPRRALPLAALRAGLAHRLQRPDPALVARPAGLDALADPDLLLGQLLVEEGVLALLGREELLLAFEEGRVVAGPVVEPAPVELDDAGRQPPQEHPVVSDEHQRAAGAEQELFEPADRVDVEVVGRLVEQQDVGVADQGLGQQDAPLHARGEIHEPGVGVQVHPGDDRIDPVVGTRRRAELLEPLGHLVGDRAALSLGHLLRKEGDAQALLADHLALVGRDLASKEPQQRALALAVAAQKADALAPLDLQVHPIE